MKIFDTHTHDYFTAFDEDRLQMLDDDFAHGVRNKIQIGCDLDTSNQALALSQTDDRMYCTVGIHPCYTEENYENADAIFEKFTQMLEQYPDKIVGIGETGFDFFHKDTPETRMQQEDLFLRHCVLASQYNKPLVVHTRGAREETLQFFREHYAQFPNLKAVIHCFSEDSDFANEVTSSYGFYLGIGGVCTYKKNEDIRLAIANTPIKYLVTETDSPYLAPQSVRGKRNQSKYIQDVIEKIAEVKNMNKDYCAENLYNNALQLFSIVQ